MIRVIEVLLYPRPQRRAVRWSGNISCLKTILVEIRTIQNIPKVAPHMIEKKTVNAYEVAGIQNATHDSPQISVMSAAVSILLNRSLKMPITGRPTAVPKFKKPAMFVACACDNPMELAKSGNE